MASKIQLFLCYAPQDESLAEELGQYMGGLQRQGFFDVYDAREISAGEEWAKEIDKYLNSADIILLLISSYFINSDFCYLVETRRAIERHMRGEACVIPVILRPVYWKQTPFAGLQPLPRNNKPVSDSSWFSQDHALFDVAEGVRKVAEKLRPEEVFPMVSSRSLRKAAEKLYQEEGGNQSL